jgi:hypothetical protein
VTTFKAFLRTRNPADADAYAVEKGLSWGFCPLDGFCYVGERSEIAKVCIDVQTPSGTPRNME